MSGIAARKQIEIIDWLNCNKNDTGYAELIDSEIIQNVFESRKT